LKNIKKLRWFFRKGDKYKMGKKVNPEMLSIDKRIIYRRLLAGEILEKDLQNLFKKLPDVSDNAEEVNPEESEK